ncbi:ribonuclease [Halpernia humi]|uniref:Ribonuclease n=1 Tax=Halpernia humi TaxID=493375 RepID=A0A1H5YQQ8_9FLAO|nr:ribonuclease domain-containing protein [Halpernia humi]SEG26443.1 ribonuclease [Halpernia humi]
MNPEKRKIFLAFLFGGMGMFLVMYLFNGFPKKNTSAENQNNDTKTEVLKSNNQNTSANISEITKAEKVISYVKTNHHLPEFYLTKNEAKQQGWISSKGNLCEVLPGKAIGGDYFSNREKKLPSGEKYFEADVNYNCGNRNADRIIFTKNGDVYLTTDHYKSFQKQ